MICVRQLVACLAVAATAGLGADARGPDAVRAVEATTAVFADVGVSNGAIAEVADAGLQDGCGPSRCKCCRQPSKCLTRMKLPQRELAETWDNDSAEF